MKKILYKNQETGGISIVIPAAREAIEKALGYSFESEEEYESFVINKSIPEGAEGVRSIEDTDMPASREHRDAWCDVTPSSSIDIDVSKVRDITLEKLRLERNAQLLATDKELVMAMEKGEDLTEIKQKRQDLRDATEPLKALDVKDKINDDVLIEEIKQLSILTGVK